MIRLPMLNVDAGFACSFCCEWAALSAAPMHRRLTGEGPWQRDDVESEVLDGSGALAWVEAQSVPIVCSADVSSRESATRE